jgi:hypothetical protein
LPDAQGYDDMRYVGLYRLNAYTYADPTWFPDMSPELRAMFERVTKGSMSAKAGEKAKEDFKINGQYVDTSDKGVVGIPFFDDYVENAGLDFIEEGAKSGKRFFVNINESAPAEHAGARIYRKVSGQVQVRGLGRRERRASWPHNG